MTLYFTIIHQKGLRDFNYYYICMLNSCISWLIMVTQIDMQSCLQSICGILYETS